VKVLKNSLLIEAISNSPWRSLAGEVEALERRRVAVLMGGVGDEREISLLSGRAVFDALRRELDDVIAIDFNGEDAPALKTLLDRADTVFVALHGRYGEDGAIQACLDQLGVPYTGSGPHGSRCSFFKDVSRRMFLSAGIPVPEGVAIPLERRCLLEHTGRMGLPLVLKPVDSGSSIGVSIIRRAEDIDAAFDKAVRAARQALLLERYVEGREITIGILGNKTLPPIELKPAREFYDYEAKYIDDRTVYIVPAQLPPVSAALAAELALRAFSVLGCSGFGRVDMIISSAGPLVLEVNSIPGFTSHSLLPMAARAAGLDFTALCLLITALAEKD